MLRCKQQSFHHRLCCMWMCFNAKVAFFSFCLLFHTLILTNRTDTPLPQCLSHQLRLLADSHLTQVDGEDGVRTGALCVHLGAGCRTWQSAKLQTLQQLQNTCNVESWLKLFTLDRWEIPFAAFLKVKISSLKICAYLLTSAKWASS